jgi:cytochrome d ubiquinol oxidase subunit II
MIDLPLVFAILMGAAILAYVLLDGYDLGVGMLMPAATGDEQDVMVAGGDRTTFAYLSKHHLGER